MQVAAGLWREDVVLAVMELLEQAFRHGEGYPAHRPAPTGMSGRGLALFVLRRLAALVLLLLLLSFGMFTLLYVAPGSVEQALLGPHPATPEAVAAIRKEYHLDDPFLVQYLHWLGNALHLDFGTSSQTGEPVRSIIAERIGLTTFLAAYGFLLSLVLGVLGGVAAALHQRRPLDRAMVAVNVVGVSSPAFATGILLLYVFAVLLGWFPAFGDGDGFVDRIQHLTLPAIALALSATALVMKITRAAMIHELDQDYVVFARRAACRGGGSCSCTRSAMRWCRS